MDGLVANSTFLVTNILGSTVFSGISNANGSCKMELSHLPKGAYLLKGKSEKGNKVEKIILD